jgi:hypothetical protein
MTVPANRSLGMTRYGSDAPLPERRRLHAGPVALDLEGIDLRFVEVGGVEIVRRLYMAVRDQNWGTPPPIVSDFTLDDGGDHFRVAFHAEHREGDVDFAWTGEIVGTAEGTITYALDGEIRKPFRKNRIGFCLLHPMTLAGQEVEIVTPEGVVSSEFPERIMPDQPFLNMLGMRHRAGEGSAVEIHFEGDIFETEDQRNWTDASYKTYSTPIALPYPVAMEAGERVQQRIVIVASGAAPARDRGAAGPVAVRVANDVQAALPLLGHAHAAGMALDDTTAATLRRLAPAHLRVALDLGDAGWRAVLAEASAHATLLGADLEIAAMASTPDGGGFDDLAAALADGGPTVARVLAFPPVKRPITFPRKDLATTPAVLAAAKTAFRETTVDCQVGGGARTYFTEFNRAQTWQPFESMDVAGYTLNPQVHAFDWLSITETLEAQAETARSAAALVGETPLAIGPVSLRPPFNPNATADAPEPGPEEAPFSVDPRQLSLAAAAWTVGSLRNLSQPGVGSLTYYETHGWRGLLEAQTGLRARSVFPAAAGEIFPVFHVFAAMTDFAGGDVLAATTAQPLAVEILALRSSTRVRLLVASLVDREQTVRVELSATVLATEAVVRVLDETTAARATADAGFIAGGGTTVAVSGGALELTLRPFAVAIVDLAG